jgi:hypothetical protein
VNIGGLGLLLRPTSPELFTVDNVSLIVDLFASMPSARQACLMWLGSFLQHTFVEDSRGGREDGDPKRQRRAGKAQNDSLLIAARAIDFLLPHAEGMPDLLLVWTLEVICNYSVSQDMDYRRSVISSESIRMAADNFRSQTTISRLLELTHSCTRDEPSLWSCLASVFETCETNTSCIWLIPVLVEGNPAALPMLHDLAMALLHRTSLSQSPPPAWLVAVLSCTAAAVPAAFAVSFQAILAAICSDLGEPALVTGRSPPSLPSARPRNPKELLAYVLFLFCHCVEATHLLLPDILLVLESPACSSMAASPAARDLCLHVPTTRTATAAIAESIAQSLFSYPSHVARLVAVLVAWARGPPGVLRDAASLCIDALLDTLLSPAAALSTRESLLARSVLVTCVDGFVASILADGSPPGHTLAALILAVCDDPAAIGDTLAAHVGSPSSPSPSSTTHMPASGLLAAADATPSPAWLRLVAAFCDACDGRGRSCVGALVAGLVRRGNIGVITKLLTTSRLAIIVPFRVLTQGPGRLPASCGGSTQRHCWPHITDRPCLHTPCPSLTSGLVSPLPFLLDTQNHPRCCVVCAAKPWRVSSPSLEHRLFHRAPPPPPPPPPSCYAVFSPELCSHRSPGSSSMRPCIQPTRSFTFPLCRSLSPPRASPSHALTPSPPRASPSHALTPAGPLYAPAPRGLSGRRPAVAARRKSQPWLFA